MVIDLGPPLRSTNYAVSFFRYLRSVFQSNNWILVKGIYTLRHSLFTIFLYNFFSKFSRNLKKITQIYTRNTKLSQFLFQIQQKMCKKTMALKIVFQFMNQIRWREFMLFGLDWLLSFPKLPWMSIGLRRILFSKLDWGEEDPMSNQICYCLCNLSHASNFWFQGIYILGIYTFQIFKICEGFDFPWEYLTL
jgi:hypothetical protein